MNMYEKLAEKARKKREKNYLYILFLKERKRMIFSLSILGGFGICLIASQILYP